MDSADPPGLPRSPVRSTVNRKSQQEEVTMMNLSEGSGDKQIQKVISELNSKESSVEVVTKKQGSENLSRGSENGGSSWVEIAQEKKVLKKYDLKIVELEGGKAVEIPDEVIDKADLLWEDFLIGKFLDTDQHVARVHATVNRIWNQGESKQIDVHIVDDTTMKFKV